MPNGTWLRVISVVRSGPTRIARDDDRFRQERPHTLVVFHDFHVDDSAGAGGGDGGLFCLLGHGGDYFDFGFEVGAEVVAEDGADGGDEEGEADGVGEETGGEEDGAGEEDEEAVEDFLVGEAAFGAGQAEFCEGPGALGFGQGGTEDAGEDDDGEGGVEADTATDDEEEVEFDQRDEDEEGEEFR